MRKTLLLTLLVLLGVLGGKAATFTFGAGDCTWEKNSGYGTVSYTDSESGITFTGNATKVNTSGKLYIGLAKSGGYFVMTANTKDVTVKSVSFSAQTTSGKETKLDVYKNSASYTASGTTLSSLAGTSVGVATMTQNTFNTFDYEVGEKYLGFRNSTATGQIQIESIKIEYTTGTETPDPATVATPEFTPAGGNVTPETEISLSCATEGATIWWQNGDAEATEYTAPFTLPEGTHALTAWAAKDGMTQSAVATASFTVKNTVTPPIHAESYKLVTDPSQLVIGAKYIFVASREAGDEIPAMSTTQNKNNRGAANVKVNADLTVTPGTDVQLVTLESSPSTDYPYAFSLIDEEGNMQYLQGGGTSGAKNRLTLSTSMSDASNAKIDLTSTANPSITFNGGTYGNYLYYNYNGGSPIIAAYQNKQTATNYKILYLYVDASVTPEEPKPVKLDKPVIAKDEIGDPAIVITNPNAEGEVWYKVHVNPVSDTEEFRLYTEPIFIRYLTGGMDYYVTAYVKSTDEVRFTDSDEAVFQFSVEAEVPAATLYAPVITPGEGEYEESVTVSIDYAEENRELGEDYRIVYTLDGSAPGKDSQIYVAPIELTEPGEYTVSACVISDRADVEPGPAATATFTVKAAEPTPPAEPVMGLGEATFDFTDAELCATYGFPALPDVGKGVRLNEATIENDGISMTATNVASTNGVQWWHSTNADAGLGLRIYRNNSVTFTMPGGMIETITVVENSETPKSVSCSGTFVTKGTWAVNGETVTISAPSNGNVYVDRVIITYKPTTDNFAPGALFFEQEQASGRVETDEDGNIITTRELSFVGTMHPIFVRSADAHVQDSEGMDIRLVLADASEAGITVSKAISTLNAKVMLSAATGKYHLIYGGHEEADLPAAPVAAHLSLYDLMQEAEANLHRYVKMAFVYYDAEAGTIAFPAVDDPAETMRRVNGPENPSYVVKLSDEHNVQLPATSEYISLTGVLDKANGEYLFVPTLREVATGVQNVYATTGISVNGRDIVAPKGSMVFTAAGVQVGTCGLQPGLYLVVTPQGETAKCLIK